LCVLAACVLALSLAACAGGGEEDDAADGSAGAGTSGTPPPAPNGKPVISGTPNKAVRAGTAFTFRPWAWDPDDEFLTFRIENPPPWAVFQPKTGRLSGDPGPGDVGRYENIRISVSDGVNSASLAAFGIDVVATANGTITVTWLPATEREDGSPLLNLAGHKIYWGTERGEYPNSVQLDNPGVTTYVIDNLVPATYYVVATTLDANGLESVFSARVVATVR
jgi:hypothetical protein